ncbi:uncharacterized protein LOC112202033 [Rosa chinensis]|uniref:uncharacterized protein LOC112202033 n=1 Tax=Rosa chinensis TaxID=74649 RepID=UPI001AD8E352|nr:uncharacterized protein LOC112202033 [Rosa chinensis]
MSSAETSQGMMLDNNEEEDPKGTTAIAFFNKDGVIAAAESRESNEWVSETKRKIDWSPNISDKANKANYITKKILSISVGSRFQCNKMNVHLNKELEHYKKSGQEIAVSYVSDIIYKYLLTCRFRSKSFGTLIAGHDETKGFQVHRLFIKDNVVVREMDKEIGSLGSGSAYANDILVHGYDFNLSMPDGIKFAIKTVLNGSFFDKSSGGTIHAFHVSNERCFVMEPCQALNAYRDNFEHYDPGRMLFLIYNVMDTSLLSSDHFINLFRSEGDILAAHRVDERISHNFQFFLHRLVFTSREEARKVLSCSKVKMYHVKDSDPPIFTHFPYQVILDGVENIGKVTMRIGEASKETVDYMLNNCPIKNAAARHFQNRC